MKAELMYQGPDGREGFKHGEKYTLVYEVEEETNFIVLGAGTKQVVYRNWNDFHAEWQVVAIIDATAKLKGK